MSKNESRIDPKKSANLETVMEDRATTISRIGDTLLGDAPNKTKNELIDGINDVLTLIDDETVEESIKDLLAEVSGASLKRKKKNELIEIWDKLKNLDSPMAKSLGNMLRMTSRDPTANVDTNVEAQLNNIDFANLIGGPMQAAIKAQADAAMSTVNFVKEVGFYQEADPEDSTKTINKLHYVDFSYEKEIPADPNVPNSVATTEARKIKVPLLTMLTIPSIRIETLDIDFNAKLNSVEEANKSSKLGVNFSADAKFGPVKMKVTAAYQRNSSHGVKVAKEYSMNVKVKATQDEMPAGLEKILNLLE